MTDRQLPEIEDATPVEEADAAVADALIPYAGHAVVEAIGELSDLSDQEPLYAASAAVIVTGLILRDERTVQAGLRILAAHLLATALRGVVKKSVDRTRPDKAARDGQYELRKGRRYESDFNSFPSGHSAGAFAVAGAVSRHYPSAAPIAIGLAGAASAAQVLRSKHFISDIVAGAAIGIIAESLIDRLLRRAERI